jgi:hypothetical protein
MTELLIIAILIAILVIARVVTVRIRNAGIRYAVGLVAKHQAKSAPERNCRHD